MKTSLLNLFRQFRAQGETAHAALHSARTVSRFRELESEGLVRLTSEEECENYFDVYGKPDTDAEHKRIVELIERWGCVCCIAEFLNESGEWERSDSVGMCIYLRPLSPFENNYAIDLMLSATRRAESLIATRELHETIAD